MAKKHPKSLSEQINTTGFGPSPFRIKPNQASQTDGQEFMRMNASGNKRSIQLRAYQIYQEKGGSELDNWLEAERMAVKT